MDKTTVNENLVLFSGSQGQESRGRWQRLSRYNVAFELYAPETVLRTSEALRELKIYSGPRVVYSGRAVVRDLVNSGTAVVCEANLDDASFDPEFFSFVAQPDQLRERFKEFVNDWQKVIQVRPEFKVALADIQ